MLSTTMSISRPARAATSLVSSRSSPVSRTPTARAITLTTRSGEVTDSSVANATSRPAAATVSATSIARRDLPIPPGPTTVTMRTPGVASRAASSSRSAVRPTRDVNGAGIAGVLGVAGGAAPGSAGARDASKRSASSVARSAVMSSPSSAGAVNPRYELVSSDRMRPSSSSRRASRAGAGCLM